MQNADVRTLHALMGVTVTERPLTFLLRRRFLCSYCKVKVLLIGPDACLWSLTAADVDRGFISSAGLSNAALGSSSCLADAVPVGRLLEEYGGG